MNILLKGNRLSFYFQRLDALRWTQYLEDCIAVLAEKKEYPSDTLLIQMVKLQLIMEKVGQCPWHEAHEEFTDFARAPAIFYLKALQVQLQDFKTEIPPEIQKNGMIVY